MDGSLKEIHLGGLLRLLSLHRFSGALRLEDTGLRGTIFFHEGRIQGALKSPGTIPIGERLVAREMLSRKDLETALGLQKKAKNPKPLGHYLVHEMKAVPREVFRRILEEQAADNISELLRMQTGRFLFEEGVSGFEDFPLEVGTENLILHGFRSIKPADAQESLPPGSAILEWAPRPEDHALDLSFTPAEWNTLLLFDGSRNLEDILRIASGGEKQAAVTVFSLLSAGLLKKVRFRFPDLEKIAQTDLGNMGLVLVQNAYKNIGVSRARMGMRELVRILNDLEKSMTLIVGPSRSAEITERMWEATKR